jgi:Nop53 (60S ribosomal biogenesis)
LTNRGIVREKPDSELFSIDKVGGPAPVDIDSEPPKKRRKPLKVDEILGTTDTKPSTPSYIPKNKRPTTSAAPVKPVVEKKETYDVWNKVDVIPTPKDLPPPAILAYSKSVPAQAPTTIRSTRRLLRPRDKVEAVTVASAGQSYNPTLEDWEDIINKTSVEEQRRLDRITCEEWVPQPEEVETPAAENEESEEEEQGASESFLRAPVQVRRKTTSQRNKQAREAEKVNTLPIPNDN